MNPENNLEPNVLDSNNTLGTFPTTPNMGGGEVNNLGTQVNPVPQNVDNLNVTPQVQDTVVTPEATVAPAETVITPAAAAPVTPDAPSTMGISAPGNSEIDLAEISSLVEDTLTNNYVAPTLTPDANQVPDVLGTAAPTEVAPTTATPANPTMPIPDQFPNYGNTTYQAEPLTQADYATPDSFDQIGASPEIDPKAKDKKSKKTLTFLLLLLAIVGLGAGSYYLINVKKIFNNKSVTTKTLSIEVGSVLSEDINDYATFKNVNSTNCTQNFESVDVSKVGTYTYTIKCGSDEYKGTINIVDTTAPTATAKLLVAVKDSETITELSQLFGECSEENCIFEGETEDALKTALSTQGIKAVNVNIKDASGNTTKVPVPLFVTDSTGRYAINAKRNIPVSADAKYTLNETVFIVYTDSYTAATIRTYKYADANDYLEASSSNKGLESVTIDDFTGIPLFNDAESKIILVSSNLPEIVQGSYSIDYDSLNNNGYTATPIIGTEITSIDL